MSLESRTQRLVPEFVALGIQVQSVFGEEFRTWISVVAQHRCNDMEVLEVWMQIAVAFDQRVCVMNSIDQFPAFDAWLHSNVAQTAFGQLLLENCHELSKVGENSFG